MGSNGHAVATKSALRDLIDRGITNEGEMARELGVSERTIARAMIRHGFREKKEVRRIPEEVLQLVRDRVDDGVLLSWAAEDIPCTYSKLSEDIGANPETIEAWREVWPSIMRNPTLHALHLEFAPKLRRRSVHARFA